MGLDCPDDKEMKGKSGGKDEGLGQIKTASGCGHKNVITFPGRSQTINLFTYNHPWLFPFLLPPPHSVHHQILSILPPNNIPDLPTSLSHCRHLPHPSHHIVPRLLYNLLNYSQARLLNFSEPSLYYPWKGVMPLSEGCYEKQAKCKIIKYRYGVIKRHSETC